ncbi:hypothetical protein GOFOIKOB_6607 [Methylobacterium tardum]|nr:hypothetical protein GOFOIKOB_6607 [Methylobacterium tardum]
MVLLAHGGAPGLDRSAIMPPLPLREAPRIPHLAPERRRQAVDGIREKYGLSERRACRIVGQHRGTQRYMPTVLADEDALTQAIIALASEYGRYGYRRVTALLQADGWQVGKDRVQRIWRREGLKVPQKHRPRSRLWLNDGSCMRLRPLHRNHVWSFDFVQGQTHDGRSLRILTLIDEHSRACLSLRVARRINSVGVIEALADAMCLHGIPEHVRSDNVLRSEEGRLAGQQVSVREHALAA